MKPIFKIAKNISMKKNIIPLNKKVNSYATLAGTLITASAAQAQIMYTDIIPDVTLPVGGVYNLDLDNNATVDFKLQVGHYVSGSYVFDYAVIFPQVAGNCSDTVMSATSRVTTNHAFNDPLDATTLWDNAGTYGLLAANITAPIAYTVGNFLGATDRYIAFKFDIAGTTHYGWARIDLNATSTLMTIKSYGYKNPANTQSLAGEMPTGIMETLEVSTMIYASENKINVKLINHNSIEGFITVHDVLGHVVTKVKIVNEITTIEMNSSTPGIYFATVTKSDGSSFTKKVYVR